MTKRPSRSSHRSVSAMSTELSCSAAEMHLTKVRNQLGSLCGHSSCREPGWVNKDKVLSSPAQSPMLDTPAAPPGLWGLSGPSAAQVAAVQTVRVGLNFPPLRSPLQASLQALPRQTIWKDQFLRSFFQKIFFSHKITDFCNTWKMCLTSG